jgi:hypothetical protein
MEAARMEGIIVRMGVMKLSHWPHTQHLPLNRNDDNGDDKEKRCFIAQKFSRV